MASIPERVSALEVQVAGINERLQSGLAILGRLETAMDTFTAQQAYNRAAEEKQYRRMATTIRVLTLVVAVAAVVVPIVVAWLHGH